MKQYIYIGALALCLLLLIAGTTTLLLKTVNIGDLSILSVKEMKEKRQDLEIAKIDLDSTKLQFDAANLRLETSKKAYITAKDSYNNITDDQIETIKEATKEEHYYIDWLWIVLGEYADQNNLTLHVVDSRTGSEASKQGTVQIQVLGRYSDITNFVFEVENDVELKFKLDNMSMEYSSDNKVSAKFDVLSMEVLF